MLDEYVETDIWDSRALNKGKVSLLPTTNHPYSPPRIRLLSTPCVFIFLYLQMQDPNKLQHVFAMYGSYLVNADRLTADEPLAGSTGAQYLGKVFALFQMKFKHFTWASVVFGHDARRSKAISSSCPTPTFTYLVIQTVTLPVRRT